MKLTQKALSTTHRVIVYGPPGTGKTELVGRLSEYKNLLWFDLDNGYTTLLKFPDEWKERIDIISLPDTKSFPIGIETCLKVIKGGLCRICEEHGKVSCPTCTRDAKPVATVELNKLDTDTVVVFDSLTQLTASALAHITRGKDEEYKMQTDDWGSLAKLLEVFLSHVQQASYNIVCISHEVDTEKDEKAPERLVPVAGSRNTSKNSGRYFDEVIRAELKNLKHRFYSSTTAGMTFAASSRTGFRIEDLTTPSLVPLFCPDKRPANMPVQVDNTGVEAQTVQSTTKLQGILARVQAAKVALTPTPAPT